MLADDDDECSLLLLEIWCSVKNVASINKVSARGYVRYAQSPDIIHTARCLLDLELLYVKHGYSSFSLFSRDN